MVNPVLQMTCQVPVILLLRIPDELFLLIKKGSAIPDKLINVNDIKPFRGSRNGQNRRLWGKLTDNIHISSYLLCHHQTKKRLLIN